MTEKTESPEELAERERKEKEQKEIDRAAASLRAASVGGFAPLLRMLIKKHKAKFSENDFIKNILNGPDKDGNTSLYHAAFVGHVEVTEVLLGQKGIDPNRKNVKDVTPLRAGLGNDNAEAAELLLEHENDEGELEVDGSKAFHQNWNPLCHAAANGYIYVVNLLLRRDKITGVKLPLAQKLALTNAAADAANAVAAAADRAAIDAKAAADADPADTALATAAKEAADKNTDAKKAAKEAADAVGIAKEAADKEAAAGGASKEPELDLQDGDGNTALFLACSGGHIRVVKSLLKAGANINVKSKGSVTPLYGAASNGHARIVEILLDWKTGPDITLRSDEGDNALEAAVKGGHNAVAELLMEH